MCLCQNINPFSLCRFALLCNYNIASLLHQTTTEDQATATAFVWFEATAESTATTVHHIIRGRARGIWTQKHHVLAEQPLPLMCNYNIASLLHQTTTEDQATATTFVWLEATSESTATTVHHIIWGRAREIWTPTTSRAGRAAISTTTTKPSCQVNWAGSQQLYSSRPESVPLIRLPPAYNYRLQHLSLEYRRLQLQQQHMRGSLYFYFWSVSHLPLWLIINAVAFFSFYYS